MRNECKNCGHIIHQNEKYCAICGQTAVMHRLTFGYLAHEVTHYLIHVDRNIFLLIRRLTTQPGFVVKEYIAGKRKRYFPPVTFFLFMAGLLVVVFSLTHVFRIAFESWNHEVDNNLFQQFLTSRLNWIYFLLTLLYPLLYRLFYFRKPYNYVEHVVASFFWQGYLLLFFIVFLVPLIRLSDTLNGMYTAFWIYIVVQCLYYAWGYYQLFEKKTIGGFGLNLLISLLVNGLVFLVCLLGIRLYYVATRH